MNTSFKFKLRNKYRIYPSKYKKDHIMRVPYLLMFPSYQYNRVNILKSKSYVNDLIEEDINFNSISFGYYIVR